MHYEDSTEIHLHDSIVVSIPACHAGDRGSIPRRGALFTSCQPLYLTQCSTVAGCPIGVVVRFPSSNSISPVLCTFLVPLI